MGNVLLHGIRHGFICLAGGTRDRETTRFRGPARRRFRPAFRLPM